METADWGEKGCGEDVEILLYLIIIGSIHSEVYYLKIQNMKYKSIKFFFALNIVSISCDGLNNKSNSPEIKLQKMEINNSTNLPNEKNKISNLKKSMLDYMEIANPSYTKNDVEECATILNEYQVDISNSKSKNEGLAIVKVTVEKLNILNEKCDYQLIETTEREKIVEIIILESSKKGYNKAEEDVTENWRKW